MKIYLSGRITGNPEFPQEFTRAEEELKKDGHTVLNPAVLPSGFKWEEYMHVCLPMVDICDAVYMLDNGWESSQGANAEKARARTMGKLVLFQKVGA